MPKVNPHYQSLRPSYLFAEIRRRTAAFRAAHPEARLINLGIGDVTRPLPPAVIQAMHEATEEMARAETFKGYGPYAGYDFLLAEIATHDFGRHARFVYLPCTAENGFLPSLPERHVDLIYLCFPNNPTGAVATRESLGRWVEYARAHDATILFDAAYEAYIADADVPHSIYEIDGAREVAIESRSFSKSAGFTGMRLAYTVVPKEARGRLADGTPASLNALWQRRVGMKSNGPPYVIQKAAAAVYTREGQKQVKALVDYYMDNARIIRSGLAGAGLTVYGGSNAPYLWVRTPARLSSREFLDKLLAGAD